METLDEKARRAYRARLADIDRELDEAAERADLDGPTACRASAKRSSSNSNRPQASAVADGSRDRARNVPGSPCARPSSQRWRGSPRPTPGSAATSVTTCGPASSARYDGP